MEESFSRFIWKCTFQWPWRRMNIYSGIPACQAFKQHIIDAKIHGGLVQIVDILLSSDNKELKLTPQAVRWQSCYIQVFSSSYRKRALMIFEWKTWVSYVGKNCTKLRPRSCEIVMTANIDTFGSLIASLRPCNCLETSWIIPAYRSK